MLFTFPSRYWSTIGHRLVFRLGRWSCPLQPGFLVSRPTQVTAPDPTSRYAYGALTRSGPAFQPGSASDSRDPTGRQTPPDDPSYPDEATAAAFCAPPVWAPPRSLAATGGITRLFPSPRGTEMFQFPRFASQWLCIHHHDDRASPRPGCPIRRPGDPRLRAAPPGFSQLATSFLACLCPGIHRAPSLA